MRWRAFIVAAWVLGPGCTDASQPAQVDGGPRELRDAAADAGGVDAGWPGVDHGWPEAGVWSNGGEWLERGVPEIDQQQSEPTLLFHDGPDLFRWTMGQDAAEPLASYDDGPHRGRLSPDRRTLSYQAQARLHVIEVDGGRPRALGDTMTGHWSGDGMRIGWSQVEGARVVSLRGDEIVTVGSPGMELLALDYRGQWALLEDGDGACARTLLYEVDGARTRVLDSPQAPKCNAIGDMAWHPTEPILAFTHKTGTWGMTRSSLHLYHVAGDERLTVVEDSEQGAYDFRPIWDPLGDYLVYYQDHRIHRVGLRADDVHPLGDAPGRSFGLKIPPTGSAVSLPAPGVLRVFAMHGDRVVDLEDRSFESPNTRWSPDGSRIAFDHGPEGWKAVRPDGTGLNELHTGTDQQLPELTWVTTEHVLIEPYPFFTGDSYLVWVDGSHPPIKLPRTHAVGQGLQQRAFCTLRLDDIELREADESGYSLVAGTGTRTLTLFWPDGEGGFQSRTLGSRDYDDTTGDVECFIP